MAFTLVFCWMQTIQTFFYNCFWQCKSKAKSTKNQYAEWRKIGSTTSFRSTVQHAYSKCWCICDMQPYYSTLQPLKVIFLFTIQPKMLKTSYSLAGTLWLGTSSEMYFWLRHESTSWFLFIFQLQSQQYGAGQRKSLCALNVKSGVNIMYWTHLSSTKWWGVDKHCCVRLCTGSRCYGAKFAFTPSEKFQSLQLQRLHIIHRTRFVGAPHTKVCSRYFNRDCIQRKANGRWVLRGTTTPAPFYSLQFREFNPYRNACYTPLSADNFLDILLCNCIFSN